MIRSIVILSFSLGISGCTFSLDWLRQIQAQRAIARSDYRAAISILATIVESNPHTEKGLNAARTGAKVAHLDSKNYPAAVEFYRQIVLQSPDPEERKTAQKNIAQIYFENILDHHRAVIEYEKLLKQDLTPDEKFHFRLNLAKSYFQMNQLEQARHEIDVLLSQKPTEDQIFEAKVLKANVLVSGKQLSVAAELWEDILKEFPERSKKDNVALNLVVCYEELKDFGKAIEVLERMRGDYSDPEFLNLRIERLKERKINLPGAQGWKR